jgi:hypothetical protein
MTNIKRKESVKCNKNENKVESNQENSIREFKGANTLTLIEEILLHLC